MWRPLVAVGALAVVGLLAVFWIPAWSGDVRNVVEALSWVAAVATVIGAVILWSLSRREKPQATTQDIQSHAPRTEVRWPMVFGTLPPRAGCFQHRDTTRLSDGTCVLSGLGGVGKTQLAADHAHTMWDGRRVDLLVWITASSRDAIVSDYSRLAAALTGVEDRDAEQGARRLLEWLTATTKRWLVVLDDLFVPSDLRGLWPPHTPTGNVVVTTRRRDHALTGGHRHFVDVGLFTPTQSVAYLSEKLGNRAQGAAELADRLGHLPLALSQAAAYLADQPTVTCADYHGRLADLAPDELPDDHQKTVAATWSVSIELADTLQPKGIARPTLELAAMLDPNGIPLSVFTTPAALAYTGANNTETAKKALSCLHRLSLLTLTPDEEHRAVRVHALVQRATRESAHTGRTAARGC